MRRACDALSACILPSGYSLSSILARVDGYLYPHEAVFLYWLARDLPKDTVIVEVGSMRGRSTLCIAKGLQRRGNGRVFAVDPHIYQTESELRENIDHFSLERYITPIIAPSVETASQWKEPLALVFLDGDHSESAVEADVTAWTPHLQAGGFLLLHDSTELSSFPGPRAVASNFRALRSDFDSCGSIGSITWARRSGSTSGMMPRRYGKRAFDAAFAILFRRNND